MPIINLHIPGAGITPLNIRELTFDWWRVYRQVARAQVDQQKTKGR